ncbi:MAG: hypothetical protein IKP88_07175 [Lachnospiraceae bacterium]|nr:hypothetical protein [Erysipelotrichaceae bacterium]MBR3352142.1 hypothetical protein [Erysipelotrichaceae bacterium]MBR4342471.1 hypothetical protein [Lachnospiraceae bacterium]
MSNKARQLLSLIFIMVIPLVSRDVLIFLVKLDRWLSTVIALVLAAVGAFISIRYFKTERETPDSDE